MPTTPTTCQIGFPDRLIGLDRVDLIGSGNLALADRTVAPIARGTIGYGHDKRRRGNR